MATLQKCALGIFLALVVFPSLALANPLEFRADLAFDPGEGGQEISVEKSGVIPTNAGLILHLNTDPGNVHIFTDESKQVSYHVSVGADSRDPGAEEFIRRLILSARPTSDGVSLEAHLPWRAYPGRFSIDFEIHVPRHYNLKINTQGGNIDVQNIDGQVDLVTGGGDITAGRVGVPGNVQGSPSHSSQSPAGYVAARLETQGGRITVGDVAGALHAATSGGHITAGNVDGDAILRTGGGQVEVGRIAGNAKIETGGGNARAEKVDSGMTADTAGGEIDLTQAAGAIRAHTEGGAIHIDHVTGATQLQMDGGGIFLRQLDAPFQVSSGDGDLIAYLPRSLAATIDAEIERGTGHRIVSDPSFPLAISYHGPDGARVIRGEGSLNGGGKIISLKTNSGNIVLKIEETRAERNGMFHSARMQSFSEPAAKEAWNSEEEAAGFFEEMRLRILESWWGGIPIDAAEMQQHLVHSVSPVYPDIARKAGVEGDVALRVYVSSDGRVTDIRVLDGPPILARAAVEAVQQWQYQPLQFDGRPENVVTTLILAFHLK